MDLAELARCSGLERRKLRYVLDHQLVPELRVEIKADELGRPRRFAEDVGFGIVCAAQLQEAGLPHDTIRGFLLALLNVKFDKDIGMPALAYVLSHPVPAYADWGDNRLVRLRGEEWNLGWRRGNAGWKEIQADPIFIITLNLGRIRDQVFNEQKK